MTVAKQKTIEDLERAASSAKAALAATEQAISELAVTAPPSTDLAAEEATALRRMAKESALRRVAEAQRTELESAAAELQAARAPMVRQQLREITAEFEGALAEIAGHLWAAYEAADGIEALREKGAALVTSIGEHGFSFRPDSYFRLTIARDGVASVIQEIGAGQRANGGAGIVLLRARTPEEEAARQAKQSKFREAMEGARIAREKLRSIRELGFDRYARQED